MSFGNGTVSIMKANSIVPPDNNFHVKIEDPDGISSWIIRDGNKPKGPMVKIGNAACAVLVDVDGINPAKININTPLRVSYIDCQEDGAQGEVHLVDPAAAAATVNKWIPGRRLAPGTPLKLGTGGFNFKNPLHLAGLLIALILLIYILSLIIP